MIRRQHWLQGNKGEAIPSNAVWVDTETLPRKIGPRVVEHVLRFGWACFQRRWTGDKWTKPQWVRFTEPIRFWEWLLALSRPHTRLYVFAHNWAFDAPVLQTFTLLPKLGWTLGSVVIESPPVILTWRQEKRTIEMLDTLNWWRVPLASLGESVGVQKLDMPTTGARRKVWDLYCRNDVEVIRKATSEWWVFLRRYDLGGFARTLAGQSFRTYRHRFMDSPILIDNHPEATKLARSAYHGGRTECFRLGRVKGPIHVLDVNSLYPAVMREGKFPTILRLFTRSATLKDLVRWCSYRCVVADVDLDVPVPRFGHVHDGRLVFPIGRIREALCTPELSVALSRGWVKRVHQTAVYDSQPAFRGFVDEMYALRRAAIDRGDSVGSFLLKILMNSLYGKFAQRGNVWESAGQASDLSVKVWVDYDYESGEVVHWRQFGGIRQRLAREPEAFHSHPAIAAHVTAYARTLLWGLMETAGRANVHYVDTDSLWVNPGGLAALSRHVSGSELGALKLEGTHEWVHFHGAKDYETPNSRKIKGIRRHARVVGPGVFAQEQWTTLVGLLRTGGLGAPRTAQVEKTLTREYRKGRVVPGGRVEPLALSEW